MTIIRKTTEIALMSIGNTIARSIGGLMLFGVAGFFEYMEYKQPPTHTAHIAIFASGMALGFLMIFGGFAFPIIQKSITIVGPYVPFRRRSTDVAEDEGKV